MTPRENEARGEKRRRLIPAWEDEASPRSCTGRGGIALSRARGQGVALFLHGEIPVSMVPLGSGRFAYRYPIRPVRTAHTVWYSLKRKTLI
ncbi:hypothetical protein GW17_00031961 [Ensete ventricosum]|nr:hypothetical protein GW17_00031961 [Ensete ventricosum]RZR98904.1 hypothetical protein BHM03_00028349 [Ensete ventricosum]